jgi:hypothetical protein
MKKEKGDLGNEKKDLNKFGFVYNYSNTSFRSLPNFWPPKTIEKPTDTPR